MARDLAGAWLAGRRGRLWLVLDETLLAPRPGAAPLACLCLSVLHRHHGLPLAWRCYVPGHLPARQVDLIEAMLHQVQEILPPEAGSTSAKGVVRHFA